MRALRNAILVLNTSLVVIGLLAPAARASGVWVPVATRVERADVIVSGTIVANEENKYLIRWYESEGNIKDTGRTWNQRWLHEATLVVDDVLKGTLESSRPDTTADGSIVRSIRVLHDGMHERSDGRLSHISTDIHLRLDMTGVWFLVDGAMNGTYRASPPYHDVDYVRRCIEVIDANYAGIEPGFVPDAQTWLAPWSTEHATHVNTCMTTDGDLMVGGSFLGTLQHSGKELLSSPEWEKFIARLDTSGRIKWIHPLGCGQSFDERLIPGLDGDCLLVGDLHESCSVRGTAVSWDRARAKLIVCLSPAGDVKWTQKFHGGAQASTDRRTYPKLDLGVDASEGGYVVAGSFNGELNGGGKRIKAHGDADWFVARLDRNGTLKSLKGIRRGGEEQMRFVRADRDRVILAGSLRRPSEDNPQLLRSDVLVGAVSIDGRVAWVDTFAGRWDNQLSDLAVAPDGALFGALQITQDQVSELITGGVREATLGPGRMESFLGAWSAGGERMWLTKGCGHDIEFGRDGNVYTVGSYGDLYWNKPVEGMPEPLGDQDLFVACFNRDGQRQWVVRDGGMSGEMAWSMHLLPEHRAIITGAFDGRSFLAGQVLKARGWKDAFVMNVRLPERNQ